ncbi:DUF460 domain-containing protein [Candidatus Woesearchaeota archaeon]|nr:DUF460 domain-containing protein [Candidatus Woesearchaeota archaeon]
MVKDTRKNIIVGIDPGTTKGYAVLDLEGNLLKLTSSKNISAESIIRDITSIGSPVIVSTDVIPAPKVVKKIATATGAKIIYPEASLDFKRKRKLTSPYGKELKKENLDKHKLDSLAAANYAFKKVRNTLEKIKIVLYEENKQHLESDVRTLVLKNNISINRALQQTRL